MGFDLESVYGNPHKPKSIKVGRVCRKELLDGVDRKSTIGDPALI